MKTIIILLVSSFLFLTINSLGGKIAKPQKTSIMNSRYSKTYLEVQSIEKELERIKNKSIFEKYIYPIILIIIGYILGIQRDKVKMKKEQKEEDRKRNIDNLLKAETQCKLFEVNLQLFNVLFLSNHFNPETFNQYAHKFEEIITNLNDITSIEEEIIFSPEYKQLKNYFNQEKRDNFQYELLIVLDNYASANNISQEDAKNKNIYEIIKALKLYYKIH